MRQIRILVVDGDESIRDFMTMVLTDEGYEVYSAADQPSGLNKVKAYRPDLLIIDMPRIDHNSPHIVAAYRDKLPDSAAMFILSTSPVASTDIAAHLGVNVCIPKPFDVGNLLTCIEEYLSPQSS